MTNEELKQKVLSLASDAEFTDNKQYVTATLPSAKFKQLIKTLKESDDTLFDYLFCLSGVDYGDSFGCVYHLESTKYRHCIVIKTKTTSKENPVLDTISDIFKGAEFHEREAYDFFGIIFKDHPDMRRIFLDDHWVGFPLRKDYKDEVNIIER